MLASASKKKKKKRKKKKSVCGGFARGNVGGVVVGTPPRVTREGGRREE
jgi:hypothetical protein